MSDIGKSRPDLSVYVNNRATITRPIPVSSGLNEDSRSILIGPITTVAPEPRVNEDINWGEPSGT